MHGAILRHSEVRAVNGPRLTTLRWPAALALAALVVWPLDRLWVDWLNPDEIRPGLDAVARWLDRSSTVIWLAILFTLMFASFLFERLRRRRRPLVSAIGAWVLATVVVNVLKVVTGRPRPLHPDGMGDAVRPLFDHPDLRSFPSGHTATAVALAVTLALAWRNVWWRGALFCFAALIALGRNYIGAHHLSDICAGAAIGWAAAIVMWRVCLVLRHRVRDVEGWRRAWPMTMIAYAVLLGWLAKSPALLRDATSGEILDGMTLRTPWTRTLLEPFVGFGTRLAAEPELKAWVIAAGLWGIGLVVLLATAWKRRGWGLAVAFATYAGVSLSVALGGGAGPGALVPTTGDTTTDAAKSVVFDLQSHTGDRIDGHLSQRVGLERFEKLGYDIVVPTHHNASSVGYRLSADAAPASIDLHGIEWSTTPHTKTPLHILAYREAPIPDDVVKARTWRSFVRRAKASGCVVVLSHYWRGNEAKLPTLDELVAAGVDGFEIAGRAQETAPRTVARLRRIREAVTKHDLIGLANGDFHGRRAFNYQWNVVERRAGESEADAVWAALSRRDRPVRTVVLESEPPPMWASIALRPFHTVASYFRELNLPGRVAWLVWLIIGGWALSAWRARPAPTN